MSQPAANSPVAASFVSSVAKVVPSLLILGVLGAGWFAIHELLNNSHEHAGENADESVEAERGLVQLTPQKMTAAAIQTEVVEERPIQHVHTVPGRLQYDELLHIEVQAPLDGTIGEILVKPGDKVETGQLLAVIHSPIVGEARAEILKRSAERDFQVQKLKRIETVSNNLAAYFAAIDDGSTVADLEKAFRQRPLGEYRQDLQTSLSKLVLAKQLSENVQHLADSGTLPGRTFQERAGAVQVATAEFNAAREQAEFSVQQSMLAAQTETENAERLVKISRQRLESLLGYEEAVVSMDDPQSLSRLEVRAPFPGTIESRSKAVRERVLRSDVLMVLADTSSLYVAAEIRENDWPAVDLKTGLEISVIIPALGDKTLPAKVHYVGREVRPQTNSVSLVATIANPDGMLRPGMFVRVVVPVGEKREALACRPAAILQHEGESFVFVQVEDHTFQKTNVTTGIDDQQWVEVTSGLQAGQKVVSENAFTLKSELLLEGEAE